MYTSGQAAHISVIVPAYNAASTIGDTLASLRSQTFTDWNCIVVDDGSLDQTAAVADDLARMDGRITVLRQANQGVSTARNAGLALSQSEWIFFLDADDTIHPEHLSALHSTAMQHRHADVVYCDWRLRRSDGRTGYRRRVKLALDPVSVFAGSCAIKIHAALTRRQIILDAGRFDPTFRVCEDFDLWQRIAQIGAVFRRSPTAVADYRIVPGSASSNLESLLASSLTVIRRGHASRDAVALARAETTMALWIAGRCIGVGADAVALLSSVPFAVDLTFDAASTAELMLDGMQQGKGTADPDWAPLWPSLRIGSQHLLGWIEKWIAMPEFARLALCEMEMRIAATCHGDCDLGAVSVRRFRKSALIADVSLPDGSERLIGIVEEDGSVLGRFCIPAEHRVPAGRISGLVDEFQTIVAETAPKNAQDGSASATAGEFREDVSATAAPWDHDSPYQTLKYEQTLDAIAGHPDRALELACAEGHFTQMLARRVGHLVASDNSPTALARARIRCADLPNVEFRILDFMRDPLPSDMDLILCSGVLHSIDEVDDLALVADRISESLAPDGRLVMTHARLRGDGGATAGFDWADRFGADSIREVFSRAKGLQMVEDRSSPLYRITVFRRADTTSETGTVTVRQLPVSDCLPETVLSHFDWGGRAPAQYRRTAAGVPILMYHRITDDPVPALGRYATAPEAFKRQMEWLCSEGYSTITAEGFAAAIWQGSPLPERAVVVSFDDAYRDNLVNALPVLRRLAMTGTIFVPTDHVGRTSAWDALYGPPAPLMSWNELALVRDAGIGLSSHGGSHRPMKALSLSEVLGEARRSRADLWEKLRVETSTFAYPYGIHDEAVARALLDEGYLAGFTTESRRYRPGDRIMTVPRIEVRGGMPLADFAAMVEAA